MHIVPSRRVRRAATKHGASELWPCLHPERPETTCLCLVVKISLQMVTFFLWLRNIKDEIKDEIKNFFIIQILCPNFDKAGRTI